MLVEADVLRASALFMRDKTSKGSSKGFWWGISRSLDLLTSSNQGESALKQRCKLPRILLPSPPPAHAINSRNIMHYKL